MRKILLMLCVATTVSLAGCNKTDDATSAAAPTHATSAHTTANDDSVGSVASAPAATIANAKDAAAAATAAQDAGEAQIRDAGVAPDQVGSGAAAGAPTH